MGNSHRRQSGAVLVVSLIILLVLTLLGVTAMQGTVMEERMAGNMRSGDLAFQAAEGALREAEEWVMAIDLYDPPAPVTSCSSGTICDLWEVANVGDYIASQGATWWADNAREYGVAGTLEFAALSMDPRYIVEYVGYDPGVTEIDANNRAKQIGPHFYRTTAAGFGPELAAQRVLETSVRAWKN